MITGLLYKIFPEEVHRDFRKRRFWVQELNQKYPNMYELELWHDSTSDLEGFKLGDVVECEFIPKGRLYGNDDDRKVKVILQCTGIKMVYESRSSG